MFTTSYFNRYTQQLSPKLWTSGLETSSPDLCTTLLNLNLLPTKNRKWENATALQLDRIGSKNTRKDYDLYGGLEIQKGMEKSNQSSFRRKTILPTYKLLLTNKNIYHLYL